MAKEIIDRGEWKELLEGALAKSPSFKLLEGVNPCLVQLDGIKFWIYQKNITSTSFPGESASSDVCRIQLPKREMFQPIKESDIAFILLGYDKEHEVYVTWNPYTVKQRLNVTGNVSFYSRKSAQLLASESGDFQSGYLTNGSKFLAFKRLKLADYLLNVAEYFPEMQEYVAMGSKRRKEANEAYRKFVNRKNIDGFLGYLRAKKIVSDELCVLYFKTIKRLIDVVVNPNLTCRKLFLKYDAVEDYTKATVPLLNQEETYLLDNSEVDCLEQVLVLYVSYLMQLSDAEKKSNVLVDLLDNEEVEEEGCDVFGNPVEVDPDKKYIKNGKLLKIANPAVIEQLRPLLDVEYANRPGALNIIMDYYQAKCPNMEFRDWKRVLDEIDWSNPLPKEDNDEQRKKQYVIAVIWPDGKVIMHKNVAKTFIAARDLLGAEYFAELGLSVTDVPETTLQKVNTLYYVIDKYELDVKIAVVPLNAMNEENLDFEPYLLKEPLVLRDSNSKRDKIRITFPDGSFIQENQVVVTLLNALRLAGIKRVQNLGLMQGSKPFILTGLTEDEKRMTKYKMVDDDLWINSNTDTQFKYEILDKVNARLCLGWIVEKV